MYKSDQLVFYINPFFRFDDILIVPRHIINRIDLKEEYYE